MTEMFLACGRGEPLLAAARRQEFYFVGIGGAGLSAYANFARGWGAEVRGWDKQETIFMETLSGIELDVGGDPERLQGSRSSCRALTSGRAEGRSRAEFLAELVALRRSIVVGGAHGKTTTAAMIAYVLRELGHDPAWIIGGVVPQLGGNAGVGEGWLVVEGDESDRSIALLRPEIAVVTNIEVDHHAAFASAAELESFFDGWLARVPNVVRAWELDPVAFELAVPGEHNRMNAAAALAALELAGVLAIRRRARACTLRGRGRRFELVGRPWRRPCLRRLRAQSRPRSRSRSRPRASKPRGGSSPSTSPMSTSGRVSSSGSWAKRSGSRTRPSSRT